MIQPERPLNVAPPRSRLVERLNLARFDRVLLVASLALIAFSVFTLAESTRGEVPGQAFHFALRQAIYALAGIALMVAVSRLDLSRLRELGIPIYAAMIASIVVVLAFGTVAGGSRRWIELPYFNLQPSELAKVLLCVSLGALVLERVRRPQFGLRDTLALLGLGLAPAALIFLQPDLGTGIVLVVITVAVLFFALPPWKHFAAIGAGAAAIGLGIFTLGPAVEVEPLHGYQEERLNAFLDPGSDPRDSSYQVNQAVIAVGSGETTGRGDLATQTEFEFLPERHTDFIFAVIAERFGFVGAAAVVCIYALLLWRVLRVLRRSRNFYGVLIAGGIAAGLAFQILVNIGMNLGLMPVTGVTLPLLSYGGSSVLGTFLALGLLQGIHVQSQRGAGPRMAAIGLLPDPTRGGGAASRRAGRPRREPAGTAP
jgi:rod shape determining protein RodA